MQWVLLSGSREELSFVVVPSGEALRKDKGAGRKWLYAEGASFALLANLPFVITMECEERLQLRNNMGLIPIRQDQ
jgi:hypothetical protein